MKKKPRPIKEYGPTWHKLANQLCWNYAPNVITCVDCGYPVLEGYCCQFCGSSDPEGCTNERT